MRFLCDAMLGGLAKWLRAAGYTMLTKLASGPTSLMALWSGWRSRRDACS